MSIDKHYKIVYNIIKIKTGGDHMKSRYTQHSKVMTIANRLVKQGYNRAHAMVKAWALVKLSAVSVKVAGVTYGKRQTALEHLTHYRPQDIRVSLCRDTQNAVDSNAVAVVAAVRGKGAYTIGYLPRAFAAFIAPLMDKGKLILSRLSAICGGQELYLSYGMRIEVIV